MARKTLEAENVMDVQTSPAIEVQINLSGSEAEQLSMLAARQGISTADLIRRAIEGLMDSEAEDMADWQAMSLFSFEAGWDNEEDAVYDHWRERYGLDSR